MEGQRLGGRYQIEERIGGGGMAIVYKARDLVLNRPVAVKVLRPQFGTDEDFVNRFRREAQSVASLSHPNVVGVYDVGQDDDTYYMVMEYVEGSTLKDVINQTGALPVEEAVRIAVAISDALDHAHQNNIIHRDIKPHNILIGKNGRVKVTDFGIARAVTSATITHTNSVLGSVHYFSPEQARGGITAEKSDIYSLGVVLYEMVTGQLPFSGDSPISVALKHLQDPLPEPRTINRQIPQSVENIILKSLVKDPSLRYSSAKEMLLDLETSLLPERRDEPKILLPVDEEQTKVLPVITAEMLEQANQERETLSRRYGQPSEEPEKDKKNWWIKAIAWIGGAGLFILLALFGFNVLMDFIRVPEVNVPYVEGSPAAVAEAKIKEANLVPQIITQFDNKVAKDLVIKQDPSPTMRAKENSTVTLYVSKGKQEIPMPNVVSQSRTTAEDTLRLAGFKTENITVKEQVVENAPGGEVLTQDPPAGKSLVPDETTVTLTVSKEREYVEMPDLRGMTIEQARVALFKVHLKLAEDEITYQPSYTDKQGIIVSTQPFSPKMKVPANEAIPLQVSNGTMPAGAKIGTYPVVVEMMEGESAQVKITVSDARGDNTVFDEVVSNTQELPVPIVLAPTKNATIQVFKQGQPYQTIEVKYNSLP